MVFRRRPDPTPRAPREPEEEFSTDLEKYRRLLAISRDELDECVMGQAELYYKVGEAHNDLTSEVDALKLMIKEMEADKDDEFRAAAAEDSEAKKPTETAFKNMLVRDPELKELRRTLLALEKAAGRWAALTRAYDHRKEMLKAKVPLFLSRLSSGSMSGLHSDIADTAHRVAGQERMNRRTR